MNEEDQEENPEGEEDMYSESDDEDDDEDDEDDSEIDSEDEELDGLSETELEEMAASTRRSLLMVQMQMATYHAAEEEQAGEPVDERSSQEKWQDFLSALAETKVLKITDTDCSDFDMAQLQQQSPVLDDLMAAIRSHELGLTHVILGGKFLQQFCQGQKRLFQVFWTKHSSTLHYLKLGTDECPPNILDLNALLTVLQSTVPSPSSSEDKQETLADINLTELELRQVCLNTMDQVQSLEQVLGRATKLKQFNLMGIHVHAGIQRLGLFDPMFQIVSSLTQLDECRLSCAQVSSVPFVTPSRLTQVLEVKPKWWRLALDGTGLNDEHCKVIAQAMMRETCKAGDLLSLRLNPAISNNGWNQLFDVLFQKQRMGLVKVDDASWQANFNLVRSMNNLHGRLGYQVAGSYPSRSNWIEWLAKLSQITWEDDAHILNYLLFSLLERPDYVHR